MFGEATNSIKVGDRVSFFWCEEIHVGTVIKNQLEADAHDFMRITHFYTVTEVKLDGREFPYDRVYLMDKPDGFFTKL